MSQPSGSSPSDPLGGPNNPARRELDPPQPNRFDDVDVDALSRSIDGLTGTRILDGEYILKQCVGRGAMGAVFRADQPAMGRTVAIKVLLPQVQTDDDLVARFNREARLASRLTHPNSVHVHLFGKLEDGTLFTIMEFLDGEDLGELLVREAPLNVGRSLRIILQVLSALAEAHAAGIIHRDLKPPNIFLTTNAGVPDYVKVLDYGIAKMLQPENAEEMRSLTEAGTVFGTPEYMAPEQARGDRIDGRADLYAVAVILYVTLSAKHPFRASSSLEYLAQHVTADPTPLRRQAPTVPEPIAQVVMRNLAKDPARRCQSPAELAQELIAAWEVAAAQDPSLPPPDLEGIHLPREPDGAHGEPGAHDHQPDRRNGIDEGPSTANLRAKRKRSERSASGSGSKPAPGTEWAAQELDDAPLSGSSSGLIVLIAAIGLIVVGAIAGIFFATRGPDPGRLIIDTDPAGAMVRLDDRVEATSPARFDALPPGEHAVTVTLPGRRPVEESLAVGEGEEVVRRYGLELARVRLGLSVVGEGAVVLARRDSTLVYLGPAPVTVESVVPGEGIPVEVYAPGLKPYRANISIPDGLEDGALHNVRIEMKRAHDGKPNLRAVTAMVAGRHKDLAGCSTDAVLTGEVDVALSIEGGVVTHARVLAPGLVDTDTGACIEGVARTLKWPKLAREDVAHCVVPISFGD